jgi:glycosyltransferase involved in cell wall biosynthesis
VKILQLVTAVGEVGRTGGVAEVAMMQTEILRGLGHDVTLLAGWLGAGPPPRALRDVPAVLLPVRYPTGRRTDLRFVMSPRLQRFLRGAAGADHQPYDIAHVHLCRDLVTTFATRTLHKAGIPIVTQTHGMLTAAGNPGFRAFDRLLMRPALARASRSLLLWPGEQQQLDAVLGRPARTELVRNAVDVGRHAWAPTDPPVVLFAARLHARKQPQLFVRLAHRVHREFPEVRFVIAGPDQGEAAAVRTLISSTGLSSVVSVTGGMPREQLLELMASSTAYVLPSLDEPFPISALEAMAIGAPTVLTAQSGVSELAGRRGGALIAVPDLDGMTEAVLEVLRSPERQHELSKLGREMCATDLSPESLGVALTDCYERVRRGSA